jgi:hypothetical protein
MLGELRTMLGKPAALRLRQRGLAQRVFEGETTAIELAFKLGERASRMTLGGALGEAAGQADDKAKAILKVT